MSALEDVRFREVPLYTSFKADWRKILDRAKRESELAPGKEPKWYKVLNPVFTETNEDLEITRNSADVSFSLMMKMTSLRRNLSKNPILVVLIMKMYLDMKKLLVVLR